MNTSPKYTTFILLIAQDKTTWVTMMNLINIHSNVKPISPANMHLKKTEKLKLGALT